MFHVTLNLSETCQLIVTVSSGREHYEGLQDQQVPGDGLCWIIPVLVDDCHVIVTALPAYSGLAVTDFNPLQCSHCTV